MPFGLSNAPGSYQQMMNSIFINEGDFILSYLDDTIIYSNSLEEHEKHLEIAFTKLKSAGIILNKAKCKFYQPKIKILGYVVENGIVKPDPDKTFAIKNYEKPKNIKELRSFLRYANYARSFIKKYAELIKPLTIYLKVKRSEV